MQRRREKAVEVRNALLDAAAKVIGENGYAGCSIARVTQHAGVAHGTFYQHFASQQTLFDELLPSFGKDMQKYVKSCTEGLSELADIERAGFLANIAYLNARPWLWRLMIDTPLYAPGAAQSHLSKIIRSYARSLSRFMNEGVDTAERAYGLATMLTGARSHLLQTGPRDEEGQFIVSAVIIETYVDMVTSTIARINMIKSDLAKG